MPEHECSRDEPDGFKCEVDGSGKPTRLKVGLHVEEHKLSEDEVSSIRADLANTAAAQKGIIRKMCDSPAPDRSQIEVYAKTIGAEIAGKDPCKNKSVVYDAIDNIFNGMLVQQTMKVDREVDFKGDKNLELPYKKYFDASVWPGLRVAKVVKQRKFFEGGLGQ